MYRLPRPRTMFLWLCLAVSSACGGGGTGVTVAVGGTSGSGVVGGTSGSGITGGTVNGFGSVIVGGERYLTSADDGDIDTEFVGPAAGFDEADLAPGMLVQVAWERDDDDAPREARRITYLPELVGPVTAELAVPAAGGAPRLSVAGRTVELLDTSLFDDVYARRTAGVTALASAAGLTAGTDRVEVSGYVVERDPVDGESVIRASRIARIGVAGAGDPEEAVTGFVHASTSGAFEIVDAGGSVLTVTFDAAAVSDDDLFDNAASAQLRDGALVRVTGQLNGSDLDAVSEIRRPLDDLQPIDDPGDLDGEIEGPVTEAPGSGDEFRIAGQLVRFDGDTEFTGGSAADLTVGTLVKAEGELVGTDATRALLAAEIRIEPEAEVSLADTMATAVSLPGIEGDRTFTTRIGLTVVVRPTTVLKDDGDDSDDGRLNITDLAVGDGIEVDGYFDADGRLVAVILERDDDGADCELEARVSGSEIVGAARHYSIAGRPGLVVADVSGDTAEQVPANGFGEFEADDDGSCDVLPDGVDIDGIPVDAGFLAGEVDVEDDLDD